MAPLGARGKPWLAPLGAGVRGWHGLSFPGSFQRREGGGRAHRGQGRAGLAQELGFPLLTLPSPGDGERVKPLQAAGFPPLDHRGCRRTPGLPIRTPQSPLFPSAGRCRVPWLGIAGRGLNPPTETHIVPRPRGIPKATVADGPSLPSTPWTLQNPPPGPTVATALQLRGLSPGKAPGSVPASTGCAVGMAAPRCHLIFHHMDVFWVTRSPAPPTWGSVIPKPSTRR